MSRRVSGVNRVWTNWRDFAGYQWKRGRATPIAMRDAADVSAELLTQTSKAILQKRVYSKQIPQARNKRGQFRSRRQWKRSGELLDKEQFVPTSTGGIKHDNEAAHAEHRYNLGLPGRRQPVYTESVQWPDEAWNAQKREVSEIYRTHLRLAMEHPEDFAR